MTSIDKPQPTTPRPLRVLLLAMPDVAFGLPSIEDAPNLGILAVASNLDPAICEAKVADLVLRKRSYMRYVRRVIRETQPDIVGFSAMTFQYATAVKIANTVKTILPEVRTVLGGYHASLAYETIGRDAAGTAFDFIVRGEGEITMRELVAAIAGSAKDFSGISGLSYQRAGTFYHNAARDLADLGTLKPADPSLRLLSSFSYFGRFKGEIVETSRGCTSSCKFCSISRVYGRRYREYSLDRVIATIRRAKDDDAKAVYFVDDNLTLNVSRFEELCDRLVDEGLNDLSYWVQVSCRGIATNERLVKKMRAAGFRSVFLGIESISDRNLRFLDKCSTESEALQAIANLRKYEMAIMLAFIVANPDDTADDIREPFRFARKNKLPLLYLQFLTPYPNTRLRQELLEAGLVTNPDDFSKYDGWHCNVRTRHLSDHQLSRIYYWQYIRFYFRPSLIVEAFRLWHAPRLVLKMGPVLFLYLIVVLKEGAYVSWRRLFAAGDQ